MFVYEFIDSDVLINLNIACRSITQVLQAGGQQAGGSAIESIMLSTSTDKINLLSSRKIQ